MKIQRWILCLENEYGKVLKEFVTTDERRPDLAAVKQLAEEEQWTQPGDVFEFQPIIEASPVFLK